jgi:hypothetical protein
MRAPPRPLYRSRQFFAALRPRIDPSLRDEAFGLLIEPQRRLFESMTRRDQQHCLDVYRRLRAADHDDLDLLTAALLHDAGKGPIALWHRVAFVLLDGAAPALLRRVARPGDGASWRATMYRCLHHEALGAQLARAAGSSERTATLIRGEGPSEDDRALVALHAADEAS